ncbi:MAG: signal peptidase I [Ruminococcaceae bacterium]|nr:signal peptidase I [Oscillospiraceae bacterium]
MKKLKKVFNVIIDVLVVLVLIVSILVVTLSLTSKSQGVPNIFGYAPMSVESYSMEPTLNQGDLIFCEVTNDIGIEYKVDDIVTFPIEIDGVQTFNTHRIIEVIEDDGITYYRTQGDNKDTNPVADEEMQTSSTIVAKYTGNKIGGIGHVVGFIRTQLGFFLCVLLPMIIFFIYEAIRVVINIVAYNKEKALAEAQAAVQNAELTEEQKQRAIEEYLRSLGQSSDKGSQPDVQTPASDDESKLDE